MVYHEMRLILALTAREIDVIPDYPPDAPKFNGKVLYHAKDPNQSMFIRISRNLPVKIKRRTL
jgi:hypothetical protein